MSELMTAAGQLVPYLSAAAAAMGTAVLVTARDRLAESVVLGGRTFLDAALGRRGDGLATEAEAEAEATEAADDAGPRAALARLSPSEREALEAAVGHWLAGDDLSATALKEWMVKAAELRPGGDTHVTASGRHAVAVGQIRGDLNISFGPDSAPRTQSDR
ncbi:hypothetical protein ACFFS2_32850 [Streptomyces aurantiacus]|uniref:Uncharacterized protein n=1 Tax=Streptomyces aurantiacus TaxID=47760 RepID=A0A7G1NZF2_9ACTN|nr:hypothetical protein [Streptomyces aurantiacus]BCL27761.1 hypothetical protein GCM10017557_26200 [Streptomyces aurantiacus]